MNQSLIKIHQIYYQRFQRLALDPAFIPYFNAPTGTAKFETDIMKEFRQEILVNPNDYYGVTSWKFNSKARISGEKFKHFVDEHPGYDLYFINPFVRDLYYQNAWIQGELWHPGLMKIAELFFKKIDTTYNPLSVDHDFLNTTYCNFFVGNARFWKLYFSALEELDHFLNSAAIVQLSKTLEPTRQLSLGIFMRERLICYLLYKSQFKSLGYSFDSPREGLCVKQLELIQKPLGFLERQSIIKSTAQPWLKRFFNSRIVNTVPGITFDNICVRLLEN